MLHFIFTFILLIHGFIHLLGFAHQLTLQEEEDRRANKTSLFSGAEKVENALWLSAYALFLAAVVLFMVYSPWWWIFAISGVVLSQILIILDWQQAKYGTITNIIILLVIIPFLLQL